LNTVVHTSLTFAATRNLHKFRHDFRAEIGAAGLGALTDGFCLGRVLA